MKIAHQIVAVLLLGIYSIVVLHTAVPHSHEAQHAAHTSEAGYETPQHEHHHHQHDHGHSHHHHNHDESNSDWLEYLLHAFGDLHHSDVVQTFFDNVVFQKNEWNLTEDQVVFAVATIVVLSGSFNEEPSLVNDTVDPPPIVRNTYHLSSDPLRGPPSIS